MEETKSKPLAQAPRVKEPKAFNWAKILSAVGDGIDRLSGFFGILAALIMLELAFVVSYEVVVRKLGHPTSWTFDISNWSQLALIFLALAYTQRDRSHVRVDLLVRLLPLKAQVSLRIVTYILSAIVAFIFLWQGMRLVWDSYSTNMMTREMTRIPQWWVQWPIPLGGLILLLQLLKHIAVDVAWLIAGGKGSVEGLVSPEEEELKKVLGQ